MRKKWCIYLVLILPLLGCEELEDLADQEIEIPVTAFVTLQVAVPFDPMPESNTFSSSQTYFLGNDPVITNAVDNLDQVKKMQINLIEYEFRNFEGDFDILASGTFSLLKPYASGQGYTVPLTNVTQASFNGTEYTLEGDYSSIENVLGAGNSFIVDFRGQTDGNPALFDMFITLHGTVTVEVGVDDL